MYYFDFLNLEAYILLNSFSKKNKICLVHEFLEEDIWYLLVILRDDIHGYICISYIWENWYNEDMLFEEEKQNTEIIIQRESAYKFKDSVPIFKIDYNTYYHLKNVVSTHNDMKLKQMFAKLYKEKKYED
jgi:hypothetical protein